jgi:hypothetical protein
LVANFNNTSIELKREFHIKEIIQEFSILKSKLELLSELNLQDMNIISEYHIQEILNIVFDFNLKNSNSTKVNSVAIDLEDVENSIAVQVTSTSRKNKIQDTLDKFFTNNLDEKFEVLFIFILGKKQKNYKDLRIKGSFSFDPNEHIIDFAKITSRLLTLSSSKIEKIRNILKNDKLVVTRKENPVAKFNRNNNIKDNIIKNLISKNITYKDFERVFYDPMYQFVYDCLIIRSIEDRLYPNFDNEDNPTPTWYKAQIHNLYEYGIEVTIYCPFEIVVNSNYEWNYLNDRDKNKLPNNLQCIRAHVLQRIPYDNVVKLDMCPDPVYGYPTLFLEYKNDKTPFSEEIPCTIGYYNSDKDFRKVCYFELSNRTENL